MTEDQETQIQETEMQEHTFDSHIPYIDDDPAFDNTKLATHAEREPLDYLDTEAPECKWEVVHPFTGEPEDYQDRPENRPDRTIGERGWDQLKFRDMLDDLHITVDELEACATSQNLEWPGCDDTPYTVEWEIAMADLAVLYGVETGQCNKDGRMI